MWDLKFWFYTNFFFVYNFLNLFQDLIFFEYNDINFSIYSNISINCNFQLPVLKLHYYSFDNTLSIFDLNFNKFYLQNHNSFFRSFSFNEFYFNNSFFFNSYFSSNLLTYNSENFLQSVLFFDNFYFEEFLFFDFTLYFSFEDFRAILLYNFLDKAIFFKQIWVDFYDNDFFVKFLSFNKYLSDQSTSIFVNQQLTSFFLDFYSFNNSINFHSFYLFTADKNIDTYCLKSSYCNLFLNTMSFNQYYVEWNLKEKFVPFSIFPFFSLNIFFVPNFLYDYNYFYNISSNSFFIFNNLIFNWDFYSSDIFLKNLKNPWIIYNYFLKLIFYFFIIIIFYFFIRLFLNFIWKFLPKKLFLWIRFFLLVYLKNRFYSRFFAFMPWIIFFKEVERYKNFLILNNIINLKLDRNLFYNFKNYKRLMGNFYSYHNFRKADFYDTLELYHYKWPSLVPIPRVDAVLNSFFFFNNENTILDIF